MLQPRRLFVARVINPKGHSLGANQVIRSERRGEGNLLAAVRIDEIQRGAIGQRLQDNAAVGTIGISARLREQAADQRRDGGQPPFRQRRRRRNLHDQRPAGTLRQVPLGAADHFDGGLIGLARARAPGDKPMPHPHHGPRAGTGIVSGSRSLGKLETGLHIVQYDYILAQSFTNPHGRFGLIRQRQHRVRMSVIDELVGQKSVRKGFNRRRCGERIEKMSAELVRHRRVGKVLEDTKSFEKREVNSRMPLRFDIGQVAARDFDINGRDLLAQNVRGKPLDGGVASAVQHQVFLRAQQAAGIRPQG